MPISPENLSNILMTTNKAAFDYERTTLWQTAFVRGRIRQATVCEFYINHLRGLREKARILIDRIRGDMPYLTVHDLTHLDALWELGSGIAGKSYPLTPAEGYVFGAAVLLHDAAMCLAAFPNGLSDLTATDEWKDTLVMMSAEPNAGALSAAQIRRPSPDVVEKALPTVLRLLHARQAAELPGRKWRNAAGEYEYLIENAELRDFYGRVIGKVARSHGESILWLQSELGRPIGPLASHDGGDVNPLKLACLLRCADAAQLDARRAPGFERTVVKPEGVSDLHWTFQSKLAKPRIVKDILVYTSGSPFGLNEADAWWLCYDSIQIADRELRSVDIALEEASQERFKARRVRGAEAPKEFAKDVIPEGWDPVDASLKVSNVRNLVEMFGGSRLYRDRAAAIRELVQNAADAVRARRALDPTFAVDNEGHIFVRLSLRDGAYWLEVEDNGIGMSERTITSTLLDFGRSFWASEDARREFPGLMAKGMSPAGKFGIGFFSVFMLGDVVRVTSRRFDSAAADVRTLEFRAGLSLRPILRRAEPRETIPNGGTKVAVRLKTPPRAEGGLLTRETSFGDSEQLDFAKTVARLCASLDVDIVAELNGRRLKKIRANDWLRISGAKLVSRVRSVSHLDRDTLRYANNLRVLCSGKTVYGRACIRPRHYWEADGIATVQGLAAMQLEFVEGILVGTTDVLARDSAKLSVPRAVLAQWADEQAGIISGTNVSPDEKLIAAGIVMACGGKPGRLPIAHMNGKYLNRPSVERLLVSLSRIIIHDGDVDYDDERDQCRRSEFSSWFRPSANVLFLGDVETLRYRDSWMPHKPSYWSEVKEILDRRWKGYHVSESEEVVGSVDDVEITRDVNVISRTSVPGRKGARDSRR